MISFNTDSLRPHERFDHWCEVRGKSLFGVTIELERERRPDFQGRFSAFNIGEATFAEMKASSYRVSRTRADIARVTSNSLYISHQIRGTGWLDVGRDRVHVMPNNGFGISHSDMTFIGTPEFSDGFHYRALKIPLSGDKDLSDNARDLAPAPLFKTDRLTTLISASFTALADAGPKPTDDGDAVRHLTQLALLVRGRVTSGMPESRAALRFGFYHATRDLIRRNLHRPDLSPAMVADALTISVRQLHLLFEPTGTSFARTVMTLRLEKAKQLLTADAGQPVSGIAFACGFDSLATFYRAFRQAFGMTPGDLRFGPQPAE
ncbi:helix-turn-helix transcriptional regulator [Bradyrhizobium prioriisuperbiae]|uniref:helix-turn-helix transcriptional regulator n=1 Tax=Bradyrhizobium prioriisuperbiae TaxID=2854389 RepID=UPI0028F01931|nr:helix-turn-helix transcriptional regulator [Bradyrhizobium prioritasuperba]